MEDVKEIQKNLRNLYKERALMWFDKKPEELKAWQKKVLLLDIFNWKKPLYEDEKAFFEIFRETFKKDIKYIIAQVKGKVEVK